MESKENKPYRPPGLPDELFNGIEQLYWIRHQLSNVSSLPSGKLRDSVLSQLNSILDGALPSEKKILALQHELDVSQEQGHQLLYDLNNLERMSDQADQGLNNPKDRPSVRRLGWKWIIVLMILAFCLGKLL